ncbi:uncharacterized protein LOC122392049 [Amphibalanus amphitrite]|uniref:uncharacterized protein LOC122392049 n=1 Tax=Amphibalanus amphitrite TaxID=1232801 RepID=UPI001C8FB457|nr:uncharacterized protein LOC122392049 [Amphibalanus amphitrite]
MCLGVLTLLVAGAAAASAGTPVPPSLLVYTGAGQTGTSVTYYGSQSSLGELDNRVGSICLMGCWILYENEQYNAQSGAVLLTLGIRGCMDIDGDLQGKVSSLRYVGDPTDASLSGLTLYSRMYFSGEETFLQADSANTVSASGYQSVMVSGPDSWTIYSGEDYTGDSVCLESYGTYVWVGDEQIEYGVFWTPWELGVVGGNIRSVQKGCAEGATRLQSQPVTVRRGDAGLVVKN